MTLFSRREFVELLAQMREDIREGDCPIGMTLGAAGFVLLLPISWPLVELWGWLADKRNRPVPQPTPRPVSFNGVRQ
jgi:hypothetical protein